MHVGAPCREMTNMAVAELERLPRQRGYDLDKVYWRSRSPEAETPAPRAIGMDEIPIRKGHHHRIVVSDLDRGRQECSRHPLKPNPIASRAPSLAALAGPSAARREFASSEGRQGGLPDLGGRTCTARSTWLPRHRSREGAPSRVHEPYPRTEDRSFW
jgi:hypothetical protein